MRISERLNSRKPRGCEEIRQAWWHSSEGPLLREALALKLGVDLGDQYFLQGGPPN